MIKQLILYFNLISLSFITILLSDGIEIETNLPKEMVKDSTYIVDVVIKKGGLFGFAKYQQNFPEGFDAKPVETSEASFTYADGKMKFIWMALPEEDEVKITYALTAYDGAPTEALVEGKFSYIADNQRKSYDIPNQTIVIKSDTPEEEKIPAVAAVNRTVKPLANNAYEVSLTIDKEGVYGFSKLEEFLPAGAEAEVLNNQKAVFSQVDERAKFVWMSIPEDQQLTVTYKVKASDDILVALQAMEGNFAYLDESETKSVAVQSETPLMADASGTEETTAVQEMPDQESTTDESTTEASGVTEEIAVTEAQELAEEVQSPDDLANEEAIPGSNQEESVTEDQDAEVVADVPAPITQATTPAKKQPVTQMPDPETGIVYRVQIIAGHKMVDENYLKKAYKFNDNFITFNHEGWIKYLTADNYSVYQQARDKREALIAAQHNFPGPFVTAYNAGERITVQEALMITNQQWFK